MADDRLRMAAQRLKDGSQVVVRFGGFWDLFDGASEKGDRLIEGSPLRAEHAEILKSAEMSWIGL